MRTRIVKIQSQTRDKDGRKYMTVYGRALTYGDEASLPWGRERFQPGSIDFSDVILNVQHNRSMPIARTGGAGLELTDDGEALSFIADLSKTQRGRATMEDVEAGILRGASLEFIVKESRFEKDLEIIESAEVVGLALVDRPAYPDSTIESMKRERAKIVTPKKPRIVF